MLSSPAGRNRDDVAILTIASPPKPAAGVRISADRAQAAFTGRLGVSQAEAALPQASHSAQMDAMVWKKVALT